MAKKATRKKATKAAVKKPLPGTPIIVPRTRAFDGLKPDAKPCPVCLELAKRAAIQARAVMPLPPFPARHSDNRPCCRDCQATSTAMRLWGIHPNFDAARLCVANERCETLAMPLGLAELQGMCMEGVVQPASIDDLKAHLAWLQRNGIPINACSEYFGDEEEE